MPGSGEGSNQKKNSENIKKIYISGFFFFQQSISSGHDLIIHQSPGRFEPASLFHDDRIACLEGSSISVGVDQVSQALAEVMPGVMLLQSGRPAPGDPGSCRADDDCCGVALPHLE